MRVYVYAADTYCEDCGDAIKATLSTPESPDDECTWDSSDYPKGPYDTARDEVDSPNHCGACGVFLNNPLTGAGEQYVLEQAAAGTIPDEWRDAYSYLFVKE